MQPQDEIDLVDRLLTHMESSLNLQVQMEALLAAVEHTNSPLYTSYTKRLKSLEKDMSKRPESAVLLQLQDLAARLRGR